MDFILPPNVHARAPASAPGTSSPRLVVIAASAGGLAALIEVLAPLPATFPAAIAIVQHRGQEEPERLIELLARRTRLRVCHAEDGAPLEPGTVYVCPPGVHMTTDHCVRLLDGPKLQFVRPNADLMFESVGRAYGDRAIGVVLSGCGSDAARGSVALAQAGAIVLAQDEHSSAFSSMPLAAVKTGAVERVLPPGEIAEVLRHWSQAPAAAGTAALQVLLVDDHRIVLDGLRVLIESEHDMAVVASVDEGTAAVRAAAELAPDVVVMDLRMPGLDGIEATRQILALRPSTKVVALSAESDSRSVDEMFGAGATGYMTKHRAFGELVGAIRSVVRGEVYLSHGLIRTPSSRAPGTPD
jgi:two-component system, chemotaxis family, protein-glutamate methylesterase/glutaminase